METIRKTGLRICYLVLFAASLLIAMNVAASSEADIWRIIAVILPVYAVILSVLAGSAFEQAFLGVGPKTLRDI